MTLIEGEAVLVWLALDDEFPRPPMIGTYDTKGKRTRVSGGHVKDEFTDLIIPLRHARLVGEMLEILDKVGEYVDHPYIEGSMPNLHNIAKRAVTLLTKLEPQ